MRNVVRAANGGNSFLRLVDEMRCAGDGAAGARRVLPDERLIAPIVEFFRQDAQGARAFAERPRVRAVDAEALRRLPEAQILGRAYAEHLQSRGPDLRCDPSVAVRDGDACESDGEYLMTHLYETHDLWHVVTGFGTDPDGERGLQAFYSAQLPLGPVPPALMAGRALEALLSRPDGARGGMSSITLGWAMGRAARPLFGVRWTDHWERPLADVRREFKVADAAGL